MDEAEKVAKQLPVDVGLALSYIDLAGTMLTQMTKQLQAMGAQSPALQEVAKVFASMALHLSSQRQEIIRQVTTGLVIAGPGDVPPPRLQ